MTFVRPFTTVASPLATTILIASAAGGAPLAPTNAARVALNVQPQTDGFLISPYPSLNASTGLIVASGVIQQLPIHSGAHYAMPAVAATAAIRIWESAS